MKKAMLFLLGLCATILVQAQATSSTITATACGTYNLNGTAYTSTGQYQQTIKNVGGFDSVITLNVTINSIPTISVSSKSSVIKYGSYTSLTVTSSANSFLWSTGASISTISVNPKSTTKYTVTATDINNCYNTASATISVCTEPLSSDLPLMIYTTTPYTTLCPGQSITLESRIHPSVAGRNYDFLWFKNDYNTSPLKTTINTTTATTTTTLLTDSFTVSASNPGLYLLLVRDHDNPNAMACQNLVNVTIYANPAPSYTITGGGPYCSNATAPKVNINLSGTSPFTLSWSNGTTSSTVTGITTSPYIITPTNSGTYTVTAISDNYCTGVATNNSVSVTLNNIPTITATANPTNLCTGTNSTLNVNGSTNYVWSNSLGSGSSKIVSPTNTITYFVTGIDANGCKNTSSTKVTVYNLPTVTAIASPSTIYTGTKSSLTVSGATTYLWSTGSTATPITVTPTATTSYSVTGTDANGCKNTASASISIMPLQLISGTSFDPLSGNENKTFNDINGISYYGLSKGTLNIIPSLTPTVNKDIFNATPHYAIVKNPIILDSTRYVNNNTNDYQLVFSPSTNFPTNLMIYAVNGLIPSSPAEVRITFCSAVSSNYSACASATSVSVKGIINPAQYGTTNGSESNQLKVEQCGSQIWTTSSMNSNSTLSTGDILFYMSSTQAQIGQCAAVSIKNIEVWGYPQVSISNNEGAEVCAGSVVTLQSAISYNTEYKWEANSGNGWFTIGNDVIQKYQTSLPGTYIFRLSLPTTSGTGVITSNELTISATSCFTSNNIPAVKQTVFLEDFGSLDLADNTGHTFILNDYSDLNNPKTVTKTTTDAFRYPITPAPLGATYHGANDGYGLIDGEYCVAGLLTAYGQYHGMQGAKLAWASCVTGPINLIDPNVDHSGKVNGSCLFVNCPLNSLGKSVYTKTITNLNPGDLLQYECWISVFTNSSYGVNVNAILTDGGNSSNTITSNGTATQQADGGGTWVKISGLLTITGTSATLNIINNSNITTTGNDLVIDDIKLSRFIANPISYDRTWQGNGTWATNSNWSNKMIPTALSVITVASGELIIDQNVVVSKVIIAPGAKLTIKPNVTLTISGNLEIVSDPTGTGSLVDQGNTSISGTSSVQQYLKPGRNWYIASPVSTANSSVIKSTSGNKLWTNNESTQTWDEIINSTTSLSTMTGYVANVSTIGNVTFTGSLNTGTKTINLSRTGTINTSRGFNLVGNPYPSCVNWEMATKTNLKPTIWYRTKNANNAYVFDTYNADLHIGTNNNGNGAVSQYIPPMQAVWTRVNTDGLAGSVTFDNTMRSHPTSNILKSENEISNIRLNVSNDKNSDETIIVFNENASNSFDNYDSEKMFGTNKDLPELYTIADAEKLVINGLESFVKNSNIPLGFKTAKAGTFTISANEISGLEGIPVILEDKLLNKTQDLTQTASYTFTSDSVNDTTRFAIKLKADNGPYCCGLYSDLENAVNTIDDNSITVFAKGNSITINSTDINNGTASVFNLLGQEIITSEITGASTIITASIPAGAYFVKIEKGKTVVTKKIIVE